MCIFCSIFPLVTLKMLHHSNISPPPRPICYSNTHSTISLWEDLFAQLFPFLSICLYLILQSCMSVIVLHFLWFPVSLSLGSLSNLSTLSLGSFLHLLFMISFLSYPFSPFWQGSHSPTHTQLSRNLPQPLSASNPGLAKENWWRHPSYGIQNSEPCKVFFSFLSIFPLHCYHSLFFDAAGS